MHEYTTKKLMCHISGISFVLNGNKCHNDEPLRSWLEKFGTRQDEDNWRQL